MGHRGVGKVDDGEARHCSDGEQASRREGERKRESRPARTLTPRRNSGGGGLRPQISGEAVKATATDVRWRRTCAA
jgi:hypothetical protein